MGKQITVFNFDHVYEQERFYKESSYQWIDLTDLTGVNGYLDEASMKEIRERMRQKERTYLNFIDSGNYHYMTYLLMEQIESDFTLVLFDHHTDMMPSRFGNLMSCGCWVKRALDENPYLKQVIIIGVSDSLLDTMEKQYKQRVSLFPQSEIERDDFWREKMIKQIEYPVYISVDKDVFDEEEAKTNWDQGSLTLRQLKLALNEIHNKKAIIGVDVCGESSTASKINDRANADILHMI
ncbi:arginase [Lachnospiraceae bacterium KM106-2]|nr:arginase [Lachnospiraceae bacterium KM106-2]